MKKFLKRLFIFIPISIIAYSIMIFVWGEFAPKFLKPNLSTIRSNETFVRLQEVKDIKDIDILFLGSSRAYSTFDVRVYENLGFKVFNLGTSGQSPIQTDILLKRYLEVLSPKIVIYEVSPQVFTSDGIESGIDIIANGKLDLNSFSMSFQLNHLKLFNSLIFRSYIELFNAKPNVSEFSNKSGRKYINGGYVEVEMMNFKPIKRHKSVFETEKNNKQVVAFESIVDQLNEAGTKLIFVQVPFIEKVYKMYDNDQFKEFILKYGIYYDFNQYKELTEVKYFRDDFHLNLSGVELFNKYLIELVGLK